MVHCLFTGQYYTEDFTTFTDDLQMLYRQLEDQQVARPTIFISGANIPLTKASVLLAPFRDKTNTIQLQ